MSVKVMEPRGELTERDALAGELRRAFDVKMSVRGRSLVAVRPDKTVPVTLTGRRCSLNCPHCGGKYLSKMVPPEEAARAIARAQATSVLLSGGCDPDGKVPILEKLDRVKEVIAGLRVNVHPGLVCDERAMELAKIADAICFDFLQDPEAIEMMFGRRLSARDFLESYRYLRKHAGDKLVPHVLVGIRAGKMACEYEAVEILAGEGLSSLVFIVFIPTPGTRWEGMTPPPVEDVARLIAWARRKMPDVSLSLGCMRPGGAYRRRLDELAVLAGIDKIVLPSSEALKRARSLELEIQIQHECCAFPSSTGGKEKAVAGGSRAGGSRSAVSHVGVSLGTAIALGLSSAKSACLPTTAYISVGERCVRDCAFCPRARSSRARADLISRVTWPPFPWPEVLASLAGPDAAKRICRICLQLVESPETMPVALRILQDIRNSGGFLSRIPVSVSVSPYSVSRVRQLFAAGASRIGLPLDAVDPESHLRIKGQDLERAWAVLREAARLFPGRITTHFIAGLGETEEEMVHAMARALDMGIGIGLFAFTPVRGTTLEERRPPDVSSYRRLQIALALLKNGVSLSDFRFSRGRISEIRCGDRADVIEADLLRGKAFETTGCPGCNRPYYNESPGSIPMNYPRALRPDEARRCLAESGLVRKGDRFVAEVGDGEAEALEDGSL